MPERPFRRQIVQHERATRRAIGDGLAQLRTDAGLTQAAVARAAGIDRSFLGRIERGERPASIAVLIAIATVLGADLSVRPFPTTGPRIHDRSQAAMVEAVLRVLGPRWTATPEVPLYRPARGVADLVLADEGASVAVDAEFQGQLRRLEQQVRWHAEKEASLPSSHVWREIASATGPPRTSRLLVLRSTRELRRLADTYSATLATAYPARCRAVFDALTTEEAPWPGAGILWVSLDGSSAKVLADPPPGVRLGRG